MGTGQWEMGFPQLRGKLEETRVTNQSFHDFEVEHNFPTIGRKIMLLNGRSIVNERKGTRDHLILLAMEDITARKEVERQKRSVA